MMTEYAACLGIDWADKKHDLCLLDAATGKKTKQVLPHTPQAIAEYFTNLRARYPGQQIAVGLEQSRGCSETAQLDFSVAPAVSREIDYKGFWSDHICSRKDGGSRMALGSADSPYIFTLQLFGGINRAKRLILKK